MGSKVDTLYETEIRDLPEKERLRLIELMTRDLQSAREEADGERSIMELRGLGADVWKDTEAQEYVNESRAEWDHRP